MGTEVNRPGSVRFHDSLELGCLMIATAIDSREFIFCKHLCPASTLVFLPFYPGCFLLEFPQNPYQMDPAFCSSFSCNPLLSYCSPIGMVVSCSSGARMAGPSKKACTGEGARPLCSCLDETVGIGTNLREALSCGDSAASCQ